jgi:hypothetical protein
MKINYKIIKSNLIWLKNDVLSIINEIETKLQYPACENDENDLKLQYIFFVLIIINFLCDWDEDYKNKIFLYIKRDIIFYYLLNLREKQQRKPMHCNIAMFITTG